jgi:predicted dehydrogenase
VLEAGKHVFVEKPLGATLAETEALVDFAATTDRIVMVGHLLEYHPAVERLKEMITSGELGEIRYVYSTRLNLGKLRTDENALWSLGPHDVSVALALIDEEPSEITARGESYMNEGVEDVVFGYMRFPSGVAAHLHISWLDPHKERRITVVGSKRMATFDDMKIEGKLTIYDKGFDESYESYGEYLARSGDITMPQISNEEPLRIVCRHFVECIQTGATPRTDARSGLRTVRVLEELQNSLDASRAGAEV